MHQIAKKSAEIPKKSRKVVRETSPSVKNRSADMPACFKLSGLYGSFPKHHWYKINSEKFSDWALATNEFIRFRKFSQKSSKCPEKLTGKLAQEWPRITLEHLQESALRVILLRGSAAKCSGKRPEKPGEARKSSENQFLKNHKIIIFSTPQQQNVRIQILLISELPAYRNAFLSIITLIYYRKNSQIKCS